MPVELRIQGMAGNGPGNDGRKRTQLDQAVGPGETVFRKNFGKHAEFRGAVTGALNAAKEKGSKHHGQAPESETSQSDPHDENLGELRAQNHRTLAVTIGEITARRREQHEGRREQNSRKEIQIASRAFRDCRIRDNGNDNPSVGVVAEGFLKLRGPDAPESALPSGDSFGCRHVECLCVHIVLLFYHGCHDIRLAAAESALAVTVSAVSWVV